MTTDQLVALIRDEWANTTRHTGQVRGESTWATGGPVGIMIHHTAPPNPFPVASLAGASDGRLKANIAPRRDGELVVITAAACNYSSGMGSSVVLAETRRDTAPTDLALRRGLADNTNGNPWYWNLEVDHPGNGTPIPAPQWNATVAACIALCRHHGWTANRIIAHAEWTRRKQDPRWDTPNAHTNTTAIRTAVTHELEEPPPMTDLTPTPDQLPRSVFDAAWTRFTTAGQPPVQDATRTHNVYREDLAWHYDRYLLPMLRRIDALETRINELELGSGGVSEERVRAIIRDTRLQP